jgi:hypothetical protein
MLKEEILYYLREGQSNLDETLDASFKAAAKYGIKYIVIFCGQGQGIIKAIDNYLPNELYSNIKLIAATFPRNIRLSDGTRFNLPSDVKKRLKKLSIPIVRLTNNDLKKNIVKKSGISLRKIKIICSMLGGGFPLCIEGAVAACEKGIVRAGECVIAMSADTAMIITTSDIKYFPGAFVIREILCKPAILDITRKEKPLEEKKE